MADREWSALYAAGRQSLSDLVLEHAAAAGTSTPACPEWTVHDVVAHVTGIAADLVAQRLDGVGTDAWTSAQVDSRRDRTIEQIVDEWTSIAPQFESGLDLLGPGAGQPSVSDLTIHEHDARGALNAPGNRESDGIAVAFEYYAQSLGARVTEHGLPALRLIGDGDEQVAGDGEPTATVRATRFDLVRTLSGRRSSAQVRALDWTGDPTPYLDVISAYGARTDDLVE